MCTAELTPFNKILTVFCQIHNSEGSRLESILQLKSETIITGNNERNFNPWDSFTAK